MPADGDETEAVQVTRTGEYNYNAFESYDGTLVYYWNSGGVWQVPADGGEETQVFESIVGPVGFAVAEEGIYFIADDGTAVRFFDFDTRGIRDVATLDNERASAYLSVSRDGRTILYTQQDTLLSDLMLVENFR